MTGSSQYSLFPQEWKDLAQKHKINLAGACPAQEDPEKEGAFLEWLSQGRSGTMQWLHSHAALKYRPASLLPGVKTLVFTSLSYHQDPAPWDEDPGRGRIARYAWGRDYHKVLGNRIKALARDLEKTFPGEGFRGFTDSGPLDERYYASKAGLGFLGRHTLLIDPSRGSWFVLGVLLTTLDLGSVDQVPHYGCPSSCRRCLDVCPTKALEAPGLLDPRRCISYLTIESQESIPTQMRKSLGNWVFGCDLCQQVCPYNLKSLPTNEPDFLAHRSGSSLPLEELLNIKPEEFVQQFAGGPVIRAGREVLLRSACVAAGNSGRKELIPLLRDILEKESSLVAEHARWAIIELGGNP